MLVSSDQLMRAKSALPATFSLANYENLQSLKLANVHDAKLVPIVLKQITSTELKHLFLDWNLVYPRDSIQNKFPCDLSEVGDILAGDRFSNLSMVEIQFYLNDLHDKQAIIEAEDEVQRCMPMRDGQDFYQLRFKALEVYDESSGCPSW
jgi:hypothetical protein